MTTNPFEFKFPDEIKPHDVIDLFVPVFGEYYNVPEVGHTFINGARGSGKSMMFRYMRPDCQMLVDKQGNVQSVPRSLHNLEYLGVYVPIKKGQLDKTDIRILENKHGEAVLNEHFMVLHFAIKIFDDLLKISQTTPWVDSGLNYFYSDTYLPLLLEAGIDCEDNSSSFTKVADVWACIIKDLKYQLKQFERGYLNRLIGATENVKYDGPILLYSDFLFELLRAVRRLPFLPDGPIFLLVDDADNLNTIQKKILNSWVSQRTTNEISLKISTQLRYNTFRTINDSRIDTPHDYSEVNLNDIYTTKKGLFLERMKDMIKRRLIKNGYGDASAYDFFPNDREQEARISVIFKTYEAKHDYHFAYRYARPDFIKQLEGNRYTYSYAGFEQLVNVSSGIMREFINFSYKMYSSQQAKLPNQPIDFIQSSIQDQQIRQYSDDFLYSEFDKLISDSENDSSKLTKLRNLINGLGGLFFTILISDASERRVFSIALKDEPSAELKEILELGVQFGYLHKSLIGNKHGTGKSRLYILNRLLAPHFNLDPSSFAGYKFVESQTLALALDKPQAFVELMKKNIKNSGSPTIQQSISFGE
jgi:hypothetical protein